MVDAYQTRQTAPPEKPPSFSCLCRSALRRRVSVPVPVGVVQHTLIFTCVSMDPRGVHEIGLMSHVAGLEMMR